jgi:outer membrane lipoprotein carrier protein
VKRRILALLSIGLLSLLLTGESSRAVGRGEVSRLLASILRDEATQPAAQDAHAVVRTLESYYHSASTLKATFLERYSEGGRVVRVESGIVYFRRPGRMRWEYESPEEKLFVADGKNVWFYVPADRTVTRARMKESADWRTPLALLTRKAQLSGICGRIDLASQPMGAGAHAVLHCWPREPAAKGQVRGSSSGADAKEGSGAFREALLEVDADHGDLLRVVIRQSGGVELEYRFGNWQQNPPLSEALFHFQPPVGVAIVDESALGRPSP